MSNDAGVAFGPSTVIALVASIGIAIGALLDWSSGPIGVNSTHLMVSSLINPFKYTKQHGPYVGWFLLALAGVGLVAAFVRGARVLRVPVGLASSAFAVLYVGQTMRVLDKVPKHPSLTKFIGPGPWVVVVAGLALTASAFFSAEERAPIGRWINIATVVIVAGACGWALTNGSFKVPSFPGSLGPTGSTSAPVADARKLLSASDVTKLFESHQAGVQVTLEGGAGCVWTGRSGTSTYRLEVSAFAGTQAYDIDAKAGLVTPVSGIGDRAIVSTDSMGQVLTVTLVKHDKTVLLRFQKMLGTGNNPTVVRSAKPEILALARIAASHV